MPKVLRFNLNYLLFSSLLVSFLRFSFLRFSFLISCTPPSETGQFLLPLVILVFLAFLIKEPKQPQWDHISLTRFDHIGSGITILALNLGVLTSNNKFVLIVHLEIK